MSAILGSAVTIPRQFSALAARPPLAFPAIFALPTIVHGMLLTTSPGRVWISNARAAGS
jgi:hypothetical protein